MHTYLMVNAGGVDWVSSIFGNPGFEDELMTVNHLLPSA